ncbi:MAG: bifunctional heptose 7-phosphate kinase/heptose 1-phosphate adenyltransferase [Acidobacteria bacterium]|nr:MAG: bifunctional heptose 7-phosphate kinase/heptose 1-phosphate adenyltransferase [Acidobacteriota bacterium]
MFKDLQKVVETVERGFYGRRVLVVGDLMLDRYLWGAVERISPEAPVPVVRLDHKTHVAGGAGNVAVNLRGLGCAVSLAGIVGDDEDGRQLLELLQNVSVGTAAILAAPGRPTICKTRILGGRQQMLRVDVEKAGELSSELQGALLERIETQISGCSAIILSDYGKGLLSASVCQAIIRRGRELSIPTFVDPKGLHYEKYAGCDAISPNRMELVAATSTDHSDLDLLLQKGEQLRNHLGIQSLVVTLGELGITLIESGSVQRFPALAREVFDVSGAGDTVIATTGAAIAAGLPLHEAIRLANVAAGIVVGKLGTVPISKDELIARLASDRETSQGDKICSQESLMKRAAQWRVSGQKIVFTNGCFDLLHVGHLALLEQAKREGDCLVVALNTDRSVRSLKGSGRPIISEDARARIVAALPSVDAVVLFDEETPLGLIRAIKPNVLVKGGDYSEEEVVGANDMKSWGGKVSLIPLVEGSSTTEILKRAIASLGPESLGLIQ